MDNWQEIPGAEPDMKNNNKELVQFLANIISNWYWFVLSGILGVIIAYIYLNFQTPVYKINSKILINDEKKGGGIGGQGDILDLGSLMGGKNSVDNEAEILKTRNLMEQVVKDLNANITYYYYSSIRMDELYDSPFTVKLINVRDSISGVSFDIKPLGANKMVLTSKDFSKTVTFNQPFILENIGKIQIERNSGIPFYHEKYSFSLTSLDNKVADFMSRLQVQVTNKQVSTIDLSFEYSVPKRGEDILGSLIKKYVQGNLNDKNIIADSTIAFIENRLMYVGDELGGIEGNIQRFRQNSRITDIEAQSKLLIENSSEYDEELAKIETQLSILNSLNEYLKDDSKNKRVLPSSVLEGDMVFNGLIERYNALLLDRDRQSLSSTETNPYIQNLDQQIANLRKDMLSNLLNTRSSLTISRDRLRSRTGKMEGQIRKVPSTQRTYLDMARQQQIKQELYIYLLQKREETAISKTSNISNSKIIDPPKSDSKPISPKKMMILFIGLLTGAAIPFAFLYLKEMLNTKVINKEDVSNNTTIPIIAEISNSIGSETILVTKDARSPIAEQFRALRTNLSFFLKGDEKTVLLTSSMSGEGKSFIALNMATVLAIAGKKVVVMEMDLRKPNLSIKLNISNNFGFTNYIISKDINPSDIVVPSKIDDNLFIISSGPIPPNPAETILDVRMDELMSYLKLNFDYIIIDAPPIGLVTDAQLLGKFADLTLYVLRQGYTFRAQLEIPNDIYRNKKMKKIALLLNDVSATGTYGYGYNYGYGYGNYGNEAQKTKKSWFGK